MASIDARKSGAVMLGDKARYVPVKALTTAPSAPTKHVNSAPTKKAGVEIDGFSLTNGEYERYRRAVLLAGMKGNKVYICPNKTYTIVREAQWDEKQGKMIRKDGESRRYDFIEYRG